jgi:glycosyltransferase involved in cell wall biosynthesis
MKIAVASSGLGHVTRGIEAWASDLAATLATRGENVALYMGGMGPRAWYEHAVPCWRRDDGRTARLLRWLPKRGSWRLGLATGYGIEQVTFALNLLGRLRRGRFDVLHVQDPQLAAIARRARRLGLVRARTILAHGTEETPAFLARFPFVQHLAPWHLEQARAAGVWRPTWTAIPNFIDTDRFRPGRSDLLRDELGIPPGDLVVLTVAAIKRHHKRIDHLLTEWARVVDHAPGNTAWLVVAGGREAETDALVAQGRARFGDRVRFLVGFPRSRMPDLYRAADAFVLCSLLEMMPIALIEAAASGLPCLVHDHPVLRWVVGPGGEAIDMRAPGTLAAALARLLGDPGRRIELGAGGRSHCVESFGRDRVVDQILAYYRRVVAPASTPADAGMNPAETEPLR